MNGTLTHPSDRASRFIRDALLAPEQVDDVVLAPRPAQPSKDTNRPVHAHGDYGHADYGHADYGHADYGHADR